MLKKFIQDFLDSLHPVAYLAVRLRVRSPLSYLANGFYAASNMSK